MMTPPIYIPGMAARQAFETCRVEDLDARSPLPDHARGAEGPERAGHPLAGGPELRGQLLLRARHPERATAAEGVALPRVPEDQPQRLQRKRFLPVKIRMKRSKRLHGMRRTLDDPHCSQVIDNPTT
jgi:hypothetical protein